MPGAGIPEERSALTHSRPSDFLACTFACTACVRDSLMMLKKKKKKKNLNKLMEAGLGKGRLFSLLAFSPLKYKGASSQEASTIVMC